VEGLKFVIEDSGTVISRDPLPMVMADAQQIGQLFQNLLTNAISFAARIRHPSRFPSKKIEATGKFQFAIMASASRKSTPIASSSSSSGCIQRPNIQAQASGWPSARKSSSGMAVESGSSRQLVEVLRFVSRFLLNQSAM
jgi:hypothetical protein